VFSQNTSTFAPVVMPCETSAVTVPVSLSVRVVSVPVLAASSVGPDFFTLS
jgi:hypothetical protein